MTTALIETCQIPPPAVAVAAAEDELIVPLTFFDIKWVHYHLVRRLLFYHNPCSKPQFLDTIVPNLKRTLSLTLKHYLPVAGNLLYPHDTEKKPKLRYVAGDSVPVTIAESAADFDSLTGNHARDADQFYDFVPPMPPIGEESEYSVVPIFAVQVTHFPGKGICIGLSNHHCLGDARSIFGFMSAWAEINRSSGDAEFLSKSADSLPTFDRSFVPDPNEVDSVFWKIMRNRPLQPSSFPLPTNRVRSTFLLRQSDIKKLKDEAQSSSFVAAAAYIWSCLVKSGEKADDSTPELIIIPGDARGRTDPPVPANYFGNCIVAGIVSLEHGKLAGDGGFAAAAAAIGGEIKRKLTNKDEILKGAENWMTEIFKCFGKSVVGISGSPKFDLASVDFGWGKAKKMEALLIDGENSVSLSSSDGGGLEVGVSLPRERMEAFAAVFAQGLTAS